MTNPVVILRGAPPATERQPVGQPYSGRALALGLSTYFYAAGDADADEDRFGLGAVLVAFGPLVLHALILVPDAIAPSMLAEVEAWATAQHVGTSGGLPPWRVVRVADYFDPRATRAAKPWAFVPNAYSAGSSAFVIGADLGRLLGLVGEHVVERQGRNRGAWEVWLPGWGAVGAPVAGKRGRYVYKASPNRPPLRVQSRRVGWTVAFGPCKEDYGKPTRGGDFIDLLSLAYALDADRGAGFVEHARNVGVDVSELPVAVPTGAEGAAVVARAVTDLHRLALVLDEVAGRWFTTSQDRKEHRRRLPLAWVQSPAALADHLLRHVKVTAPLDKFDLDPAEYRAWAESFHGGWCSDEPRLRGRPFDAAAGDLSSAYPLVAYLIGWWRLITAKRLRPIDVTTALRAHVERVAVDPTAALDPRAWSRFGVTLVEVVPHGEPFVVAVDDLKRPDGRTEVLPVYCSGRSMFYAWPDVVGAAARSGRVPKIVRAVRLVPVGREEGLRSEVPVYPGLVLDTTEDPVLGLVRRRRSAKAVDDDVLSATLHTMTNGLVSGNPSRLDDVWTKAGRKWRRSERYGPWAFLPLASTVTAGSRLLLAVFDRMVRDAGGIVAYRDTDSSLVPASPEGGTLTPGDGSTVRELSFAELDAILASFDALSPEPGWPVWKVVRGEEGRPLRSVTFGPKRHAEYVVGASSPELFRADQDADLLDWTETGLGGMWADPPAMTGRCAEGGRAWSRAGVEREVRYAEMSAKERDRQGRGPAPWGRPGEPSAPTLRRLQVTTPELLGTLPKALSARIGTHYLEGVVWPSSAARVRSVVALDPGGNLAGWQQLRWLDRATGAQVPVTTDTGTTDAVALEALAVRAAGYAKPPRVAAIDEVRVTPLSVRYAGRVSPVLDASGSGAPGDLTRFRVAYEDAHGLGPGQYEALVTLAKSMPHRAFARRARTTARVARMIADGQLPSPAVARRILAALRRSDTEERTCGLDGCDHPVTDPRATYCSCADHPSHQDVAKKRRQRARRSSGDRSPNALKSTEKRRKDNRP